MYKISVDMLDHDPICARETSQIARVHDLIKIILISYCMIDNDIQFIVICFGLKS